MTILLRIWFSSSTFPLMCSFEIFFYFYIFFNGEACILALLVGFCGFEPLHIFSWKSSSLLGFGHLWEYFWFLWIALIVLIPIVVEVIMYGVDLVCLILVMRCQLGFPEPCCLFWLAHSDSFWLELFLSLPSAACIFLPQTYEVTGLQVLCLHHCLLLFPLH